MAKVLTTTPAKSRPKIQGRPGISKLKARVSDECVFSGEEVLETYRAFQSTGFRPMAATLISISFEWTRAGTS
jgi:hypothetical protein